MVEIFNYLLNTTDYRQHQMYPIINREFNNDADREFAYQFFDKYGRLPNIEELDHA